MDISPQRQTAAGSPPGQPQVPRRQKASGVIAGVSFCLLVVASLVAWYGQSPPTVDARKYLSDEGIITDNLDLIGFQDHGIVPVFPFGKDATVEFGVKGASPPKKLEVKLSRTVYFLPWHATGFHEKVEK